MPSIDLNLRRTGDTKSPQLFEALRPYHRDALSELGTRFRDTPQSKVPFSNMNGYSGAKCAFCPTSPYPREARRMGWQGTLIVLAVARTDGKLSDFRALEHAPGNLTEAILQGLKLWRLTRATDPNWSPAAVRQTFQVAYSLS
jgi:hypothetical protein